VPTPFSHAAVGFALGAWTGPGTPARRVAIAAAACAALPDIDVIGSPLGISNASLFAHRALTHSITFALVCAVLATLLIFRDDDAPGRTRIALTLGFALLSHGLLDALSTYSMGVEFFAPFSQQRFRFPWTPLGPEPWSVVSQLSQEAVLVLLPALLAGWLGFRIRRPASA
jgi:inner membrane protein